VEEEPGYANGLARSHPRGPEVADLAPATMKDVGTFSNPERPPTSDEGEQLARQHQRERLLVLRDGARKPDTPDSDHAVLDAERVPGPLCPDCVPTPQARQIGEFGCVGNVGGIARAELAEEPPELRRIDEALAAVVLVQQRDARPARELSGPHRKGEHATQRAQLSVDRGGRDVILRAPHVRKDRDAVCRDVQRLVEAERRPERLDVALGVPERALRI
jgi:hypothetical protein